jgi:2-dehydro-3-deoxyphosphogluconate aldolase / (4S)-4-hydroxy-2-oxoglutarate aldolase
MSWSKEKALKRIRDIGVVPIVRTTSTDDAIRAAEAIIASGIGMVEITMTVPNALQVVGQVAKTFGDQVLVGAGTILDRQACESAIGAGAEFIVAPSFEPHVVETALKYDKPCLPGALTPTEVLAAWRAGADMVKVFPCGPVGGPKYIQALKGPLPQIEMVPTGGVSLSNATEFIQAGATAIAVGGDLVDMKAVRAGNFEAITVIAKNFIEAVQLGRTAAQQK